MVKQNGPTRELSLAIKGFLPGLCSVSWLLRPGVCGYFRRALDLGKELRRFSAHTHTGSVTFVRFSRMVELTTVE